MNLRDDAKRHIEKVTCKLVTIKGERSIYQCGKFRLNLRTATEKNGYQYWFDVTSSY